ncbi:probable phosphomevalonate kinase [Anopheles aquasalis]|uniref:probable phosphomevalonate kinase n=1 Tax=Anopheles aquasalis TaxID=42839 RepID=UPI00215B0121|nr:probable phosphomevalonate kinase [Anopheles aquasalis]
MSEAAKETVQPRIVLLVSGKRKCGKDYLSDALLKRLGLDSAQILRISEPIKRHWATQKGLNLGELLGDGAYKENYRKEMIIWSDEQRRQDYGVFCREACRMMNREICIISDVRRRTDIQFFHETFERCRIRTLRIEASDDTRTGRGWLFESGVDDVPSECDLDDFNEWDLRIDNNGQDDTTTILEQLVALVDG